MAIKLHAFPSRDREFLSFADAALAVLPEPKDPAALQQALRVRYPASVVTVQDELARTGNEPILWYAFRTAAIGSAGSPASAGPATRAEAGRATAAGPSASSAGTAAWAILDDERRFVEVSPALARIAELPARRLLGRVVEDFSNPADPTIREDIARLWSEFRAGGSLASTLRFNHADGRPRELAYRIVADADGRGRHRLSVEVITDRPEEPPKR